jgi:hypothetical protein
MQNKILKCEIRNFVKRNSCKTCISCSIECKRITLCSFSRAGQRRPLRGERVEERAKEVPSLKLHSPPRHAAGLLDCCLSIVHHQKAVLERNLSNSSISSLRVRSTEGSPLRRNGQVQESHQSQPE